MNFNFISLITSAMGLNSSDEVQVPRGGTFTLDCPFNGVYVALNFERNGKRKLIYSRVGFGNFTFKRDGWKEQLSETSVSLSKNVQSESENGLYYCEDNFKSVQNQFYLNVIPNFTILILALSIGGCLLAIIIVVSGAVTFYLQNQKEDVGLKEQAEARNGIHSTIPAGIREYIELQT